MLASSFYSVYIFVPSLLNVKSKIKLAASIDLLCTKVGSAIALEKNKAKKNMM